MSHPLDTLAKSLSTPGIDRDALFHSSIGEEVFIYYSDPSNPEKVIREDKAGNKQSGDVIAFLMPGKKVKAKRTKRI